MLSIVHDTRRALTLHGGAEFLANRRSSGRGERTVAKCREREREMGKYERKAASGWQKFETLGHGSSER